MRNLQELHSYSQSSLLALNNGLQISVFRLQRLELVFDVLHVCLELLYFLFGPLDVVGELLEFGRGVLLRAPNNLLSAGILLHVQLLQMLRHLPDGVLLSHANLRVADLLFGIV